MIPVSFFERGWRGFWKFVLERQRIWYRRFVLKEPYPWTQDKILQKYHFCNVYRELDEGTIYLIEKLTPIKTERKKVLFNVVTYRLFNFSGFFDKIGGLLNPSEYNPQDFIKILDQLIAKGEKIFGPAYVISPPVIKPNYRPKEKHTQLAFVIEILKEKIDELIMKIDSANEAEESFNALKGIPGINNFLAYEFWTDLTYFNFFKQGRSDNDFVNVGPGARWGLNIMMGKDTKRSLLSPKTLSRINLLY